MVKPLFDIAVWVHVVLMRVYVKKKMAIHTWNDAPFQWYHRFCSAELIKVSFIGELTLLILLLD